MINKIVENKGKIDRKCAGVLGSESRVKLLAGFWEKNHSLVEIISKNALLEYAGKETFNKEEWEAFRFGVSSFGIFLDDCWKEVESLKNKPIEE